MITKMGNLGMVTEEMPAVMDSEGRASLFGPDAATQPLVEWTEETAPHDGRTRIFHVPDGSQRLVRNGICVTTILPKGQGATASAAGSDEDLSPARRLLQSLGEGDESPDFAPHKLGDQTVYVFKLSAPEMQMVSALANRNQPGQLDLSSTDEITAFVRAVLFVCVRCDNKGANYFENLGEAWQLASARNPKAARMVSALFDACCIANPLLIAPPDSQTDFGEDSEKKE